MSIRTVVVGGSGFLGGAIVRELLRRGDSVKVLDRAASRTSIEEQFGAGVTAAGGDILDRASLRRAFRGADEVYHCAGRLGTSELEDDVVGAIDANISGTVNVFEAAIATGVSVVFYPSKPNVWLNAYTITKVAAEQFAKLYEARDGVRICSLRYFNAYGPGQALGPVRKIIPTFAVQALHGRPLTVYGDGEQTVDMIYSADIARITVDFVRAGCQGEPMDCGRGVALTVNDVAAAVNAYFRNAADVVHLPMRPGECPGTKLVADIRPLERRLGSLAFAGWTDSLAETLSWYAALDDARLTDAAALSDNVA